ncbi:sugar phosphate isomerase/epimerase family protein [Promicromonospora sp. Populi]|uniref:sugar phosphate isomerase/epimerase family protein n=1 Tax=Promicromonospora sp. Populi TaxID=3239420 RepID=UPI0034E1FBA5
MNNSPHTVLPGKIPQISLGSWAFSFGPFADAPWSFDRFCDYAADAHYDGVEINGFRPHPHDEDFSVSAARALGSAIRDRGLGISGYAPDLTATPPGVAAEAEYLARIDSIARFCVAAGIDLVRVDTITPPPGPGDPAAAYPALVRTWGAAAERLAKDGLRLVWEYEPGFWLNRPSEILRLLDDVASDNFAVMFDTSHSHTIAAYGRRQGPDTEILPDGAPGLARLLAGRVGALHLIDSDGSLHDDETSSHLPFGTGDLDFAAVLAPIRDDVLLLPWWTVDYCFWRETIRDAREAVPVVAAIRDNLVRTKGIEAG